MLEHSLLVEGWEWKFFFVTCDERGSLLRQSGEQCGKGGTGGRRWRGGGSQAPDPDMVLAGPDSPVEPAIRV